MKLASLRHGRDGRLIVIRKDGNAYEEAGAIAKTLQAALDDWDSVRPELEAVSHKLDEGSLSGKPLELQALDAPLPRAYEWVDGSAYLNHVRLVRKARGAELPPSFLTDPLVYQGGSSVLLGPHDTIELLEDGFGLDFESEVAVILRDTPLGTSANQAEAHIALVVLVNDITLRELVPAELAKGFGFFQSKPATACTPFALTLDELSPFWRDGRLHLPLRTRLNGNLVGDPNAGEEMHFSFFDLIEHITKTRSFGAGTLLGSGTVSNTDSSRGVSCLAEQRTREFLEQGKAITPFLKEGDTVEIEMLDPAGRNLFGTITQRVARRQLTTEYSRS